MSSNSIKSEWYKSPGCTNSDRATRSVVKELYLPTLLKDYQISKLTSCSGPGNVALQGLDEHYSQSDCEYSEFAHPLFETASDPPVKKARYAQFDPGADEQVSKWSFSDEQEALVLIHFTQFQREEVLREKSHFHSSAPVPDSEILKILKLEDNMLELYGLKYRIK